MQERSRYNILFPKKSILFQMVALLMSIVGIYWPVFQFDFLFGWDDQWFVFNHYTSDGFTADNLKSILLDFYKGQYAPVNQFYYTVLYSAFDYDPFYFHLFSLIIHILNVGLVYYLMLHIYPLVGKKSDSSDYSKAFFGALLFAILPINIEAVAWVAASKVLLYAFFYLIGLCFYFKYIIEPKAKYYYLALLAFVISFGAKEQAVIFPISMLLLDYISGRNLLSKNVWLEKLPILLLAALFGLITIRSQNIHDNSILFYDSYARIVLIFYSFWEYLVKTIVPVNLSYLYPYPFSINETIPIWLWIYPIFTSLAIWLLSPKIPNYIMFGILFFLIHLAIVLNMFSIGRHSIIADRYAYVATIGICFILGKVMVECYHSAKLKKIVPLGFFIYIISLMFYSYSHADVWQNADTLKQLIGEKVSARDDYKYWLNKRNDY